MYISVSALFGRVLQVEETFWHSVIITSKPTRSSTVPTATVLGRNLSYNQKCANIVKVFSIGIGTKYSREEQSRSPKQRLNKYYCVAVHYHSKRLFSFMNMFVSMSVA